MHQDMRLEQIHTFQRFAEDLGRCAHCFGLTICAVTRARALGSSMTSR